MHPYDTVRAFEQKLCEYTGAPYAITTDSCTNALFLCCKYLAVEKVILPCKTYVGVAMSIINAGGKIEWKDYEWKGWYVLSPYCLVDSARHFERDMWNIMIHNPHSWYICLSFQWFKHIPIGEGGAILTDDENADYVLRKMRCDGRTERKTAKEDNFTIPGYHMYMRPDDAVRGLMLMANVKDSYEDLEETGYTDLSKHEVFK